MRTRPTLDLELQFASLDAADMDYLKAKGAFDLPPRHLQEDLVEAYFREVNPAAPILNRTQFLRDCQAERITSRLLLFAVFTAAAKACRNPLLLDNKGTNHESARRFYKATKALLDTGYEQDKLVRIQSLLLINWWWDKKDDGGRNMRACAVDAINTAQSIGMHRWDQYPRSDPVLVGLWKRIWWTCCNRDVGVAINHGLPCMINLHDSDVHPISYQDFIEEPGKQWDTQSTPYPEQELVFFIEQTKLMEGLHVIVDDHHAKNRLQELTVGLIAEREAAIRYNATLPGVRIAPAGSIGDYQDRSLRLIKEWFQHVPAVVAYDVDDIQGHQFWPGYLHILFYTNVCVRFREKSVSRPTDPRGVAEREFCQARGIAAATMISKILRNARAHGHILKFTGLLTNSIFNCLIYFLIEGQSLNSDIRRDAQHKYSQCLNVLYEFSQLWVGASLIHRLFDGIQATVQLPCNRSGTLLAGKWDSPLPGLRISSDISNSYFRQLIQDDFNYYSSSIAGTSCGNSSSSADRYTPQTNHWMDDTSPTLGTGADLPDSLDISEWCEFFDLPPV
ncbi:fungal-specific transcription factor domain-containing protein [Paraphoma chrysanthemicola]|nr:fungal-specific transcription factor domain-containing protein [Paraphoma chrysanthemicola]